MKKPEIETASAERIKLHPWTTVLSLLFEEDADFVIKIIDRTGLQIDWIIESEGRLTHKERKREYRPRIQNAYDGLSEDDKLRVVFIIANELASRNEAYSEWVRSSLEMIGWTIKEGRLTTQDAHVVELFFPQGTDHDAYVEIKRILQRATNDVVIIDGYIDGSLLSMLATNTSAGLQVKLLSFRVPSDFTLEAQKFLAQYPYFTIELRTTNEFHDRFIIIDGTEVYHIGASIKDAGRKTFMISQMEDQENVNALIAQNAQTWNRATPIAI